MWCHIILPTQDVWWPPYNNGAFASECIFSWSEETSFQDAFNRKLSFFLLFFFIFHFLLTTLWFLVGFSIHKEWKPRLSLFAENCTDLIILAEVQPNYAYMYSLFELSASNEFAFLKDKSSSQGIFPNIFLWSPTYIVLISWKIYKLFAKIFPVFNSIVVFNSGTTH